MAMYPDVQKKAQDELDRGVGRTRLPDFNDRDNLPYINAVVRELELTTSVFAITCADFARALAITRAK